MGMVPATGDVRAVDDVMNCGKCHDYTNEPEWHHHTQRRFEKRLPEHAAYAEQLHNGSEPTERGAPEVVQQATGRRSRDHRVCRGEGDTWELLPYMRSCWMHPEHMTTCRGSSMGYALHQLL